MEVGAHMSLLTERQNASHLVDYKHPAPTELYITYVELTLFYSRATVACGKISDGAKPLHPREKENNLNRSDLFVVTQRGSAEIETGRKAF
jgi:hypothetical protein